MVRGTPPTNPDEADVWLKPWVTLPRSPVMVSKTFCAAVRPVELIPPGNFPVVRPSELALLLPKIILGTTVLKKKLLAEICRYSPPKRALCLPKLQLKSSLACCTGVLRPCGRLVEVMLGSVRFTAIGDW